MRKIREIDTAALKRDNGAHVYGDHSGDRARPVWRSVVNALLTPHMRLIADESVSKNEQETPTEFSRSSSGEPLQNLRVHYFDHCFTVSLAGFFPFSTRSGKDR